LAWVQDRHLIVVWRCSNMDPPHVINPLQPNVGPTRGSSSSNHQSKSNPTTCADAIPGPAPLPFTNTTHPPMTLHTPISTTLPPLPPPPSSSWANLRANLPQSNSQTSRSTPIVSPPFFLLRPTRPYIFFPSVDKRELQQWLVSFSDKLLHTKSSARPGIRDS